MLVFSGSVFLVALVVLCAFVFFGGGVWLKSWLHKREIQKQEQIRKVLEAEQRADAILMGELYRDAEKKKQERTCRPRVRD